ncbi:hypothetical protein BG262_08355 [Floricoccus penangensis]|uniref:LysM domain-containing protein n=1 Tax=Floricoccus penangensis TaxID=1859475 RepID=A0A9Q5JI93_9LACT|nr:LysM peptidoglycan-binding domain-containing protein [Floricoccus penangensis]OFI47703.1 hypothetical protein BG262_08355 [Floricoccus penangensis]
MNLKTILATSAVLGTAAFGATAASADTISHTVQSGDTLSSISQQYMGSSDYVAAIANLNNIQDQNVIYVGQVITFDTDNMNGYTAPAEQAPAVEEAPVEQAPVVEEAPVAEQEVTETYTQPAEETYTQASAEPTYTQEVAQPSAPAASGDSSSAKEWIAFKESSGSYSATNGKYIGRYQLDSSYLNGDYSPANQERVADQYVAGRYGSWDAAKSFWVANGWY